MLDDRNCEYYIIMYSLWDINLQRDSEDLVALDHPFASNL